MFMTAQGITLLILLLISIPAGGSVIGSSSSGSPMLSEKQLAPINAIVETAIHDGKTPGAVILVGNSDGAYYQRAFGYRSLEPENILMTEDTIFDLASLTKVVATTTAVMQLVEKKKLSLDAPVSRYWHSFKKNGKSRITVRQLLTHYSGLRADLSLSPKWTGYKSAMKKIIAEKPLYPPGSCYLYSDINFEVLGEIVLRVTGQSLDKYCTKHIFVPLNMKDTGFRPSGNRISRIAPTEHRNGRLMCGEVHDPFCYAMGGVAGHAGLFSTAKDLSVFASIMLNGGSKSGVQILKPETIEQMTIPQSPPGKNRLRGLGWDLEAPFASNAKELPSVGSYGHLGYTGTALWIDSTTKTFNIILTNRVHPNGGGDVKALRSAVKAAVSDALGPISTSQILEKRPSLSSYFYANGTGHTVSSEDNTARCGTLTGIDVLCNDRFALLAGRSVGLITNHTGLDSTGRRTIDLLYNAPGVRLKKIFSPEHGLSGTADSIVSPSIDPKTGLPVYSLYGALKRPTAEMLAGLDALVFDIQDAGARFYTYISTMGYAMEAAAKKGMLFYVLDRPDPITASLVQGPVSDADLKSFTSYFPMPVRHGMTVGELAQMFNAEYVIGAKLRIIKMAGYDRSKWYDETGLKWINPSPNLRSLTEAALYPGVAMVEGANVSVGRGTETPFEVLGAPWIDAVRLADYLNDRVIAGVTFKAVDFKPDSSNYGKRLCHGVRIILTDRMTLDPAYLGIEIVSALYRLYPNDFKLDATLGLIGARWIIEAMREGQDPQSIAIEWDKSLNQFLVKRAKYLLY